MCRCPCAWEHTNCGRGPGYIYAWDPEKLKDPAFRDLDRKDGMGAAKDPMAGDKGKEFDGPGAEFWSSKRPEHP